MRQTLTLYELNSLVRQTIETVMPHAYWVEAELSEVREVRGHCYMELVQKDPFGNTPVLQLNAGKTRGCRYVRDSNEPPDRHYTKA